MFYGAFYSGFSLSHFMGPKIGQMSWDMNYYDGICCEDHLEHSWISVGPVEPEILR